MSNVPAAAVRPHFIPPAGLRFRLVVKATGQVLYAYRDGNGMPKSGGTTAEPVNDNQFWKLIPVGGGFSGHYLIASDVGDGLAMYADNSNGHWYVSNKLKSPGSYVIKSRMSVGPTVY